jgi:uncharacterized membrane protein YoaK (UPF0700 family)
MKFKQFIIPIVIFLLGLAVSVIGALIKIQHWPYGSLILTIGSLLEFIGIIVLIVILIIHYRSKSKD